MSSILIHFQYISTDPRGHDLEILLFCGTIDDHFDLFQTRCGLFDESGSGRHGFLVELPAQRATQEKQMERWGGKPKPSPSLLTCTMTSLSIPAFPWTGIVCGWSPRLFKLSGFSMLFGLCMCLCNGEEWYFCTNPVRVFLVFCLFFSGLGVRQVETFFW